MGSTMFRTDRLLALAALASILLHLIALFSLPAFDLYRSDAEVPIEPFEARLVARAPPAEPAPAAKPEISKQRRAPVKKSMAQTHAAPPAAPRWIARPSDLGAVPPLPDGGFAASVAQADPGPTGGTRGSATGNGAVASVTDGEGGAGDYPVHRARLVYDIFYAGGPAGILTHTWSSDGHVYHAESVAEGVGLVKLFYSGKFVQRSTGRVGPHGLIPMEYTLQRGSAARSESARFDWQRGKLALAWKDQHRVVDLPGGTQDALSIVHQAYFMPPKASAAPLGVATSRKLAHYIYEVVGEELIETPIGILRSVHIRRADDDGMRLDIWLDLDRSLLPARVLGVDRRGNSFEQMIREAAIGG
jgi:Protein of unknown function (DUF3108)